MSRFNADILARAYAQVQDQRRGAEDIAVALCVRFEGFKPAPYLCPAGVPTIGYGATHYLDGSPVRLTDPPITREHAMVLLREMIRQQYGPAARKACPGADSPGRLGAVIDFAFNCGVPALRGSTLRRRINAGVWDLVPAEFRKWVRGGGRVLRGLVLRREAEVQQL